MCKFCQLKFNSTESKSLYKKLFMAVINKLECLSLSVTMTLVKYLKVRLEPTQVEFLQF